MALGEAYVVVKADLRPFAKDLKTQLKQIVGDFEKEINKSLGISLTREAEKAGDKAGDSLSRGLKNKLGDKNKEPWLSIVGALGAALDDGISALPVELKAAIVVGILAALPFIGGALTGAIVAAVGVGFAGIGVLLGSQFQQVQDRFAVFTDNARDLLVRAAVAFGPAILSAIDKVEGRLNQMEDTLTSAFGQAASYLDPLIEGVLNAIEHIVTSFDASGEEIFGFVAELGEGIGFLGDAIGQMLTTLAATGEDGEAALSDLFLATALLIVGFGELLALLTEIWAIIKEIGPLIVNMPFGLFFQVLDDVALKLGLVEQQQIAWKRSVDQSQPSFLELLVTTTKQEQAARKAAKAIEEQKRALDEARNSAFGMIDANIAFEASLDELEESLKKNGDTLAFETKEGRENLSKLSDAIRDAQRVAEERYNRGELNAVEAQKLYDSEIARITELARKQGLSAKEIRKVFDETIKLVNLPKPDATFWNQLIGWAAALRKETARAVANALKLRKMQGTGATIPWGGGIPEFADGGMVHGDTVLRAGEAGTEVIIPMTKPARAAQLAQQSGLASMLGAGGATLVQVFIGDEPLEQKMVRVVQQNNTMQALSLSHGPR